MLVTIFLAVGAVVGGPAGCGVAMSVVNATGDVSGLVGMMVRGGASAIASGAAGAAATCRVASTAACLTITAGVVGTVTETVVTVATLPSMVQI